MSCHSVSRPVICTSAHIHELVQTFPAIRYLSLPPSFSFFLPPSFPPSLPPSFPPSLSPSLPPSLVLSVVREYTQEVGPLPLSSSGRPLQDILSECPQLQFIGNRPSSIFLTLASSPAEPHPSPPPFAPPTPPPPLPRLEKTAPPQRTPSTTLSHKTGTGIYIIHPTYSSHETVSASSISLMYNSVSLLSASITL